MAAQTSSAGERNLAFYGDFWEGTPDFIKHNPGARHRRRLIRDVIGSESFSSVLDVGCGSGELLTIMQHAYPGATRLAGADLAPEQVARNQKRLPKMEFFALDVQNDALDETFDLVVCSEVIEHLDNQQTAISNLARMVKPGGRLLLTCPTGTMYPTERHFGHVRHPGATDLTEWAADAGLRVSAMWNWGWPTYRALKWATNVNAEWALKNFASGSYTRGAKFISQALYWLNFVNRRHDRRGCQIFAMFRKG
jgi:SAM-dependent methyltransferase